MNNPLPILENLYNTYNFMLYGIALEISPFYQKAEEILIRTFHKIHEQNLLAIRPALCCNTHQTGHRTAHEQLNPVN